MRKHMLGFHLLNDFNNSIDIEIIYGINLIIRRNRGGLTFKQTSHDEMNHLQFLKSNRGSSKKKALFFLPRKITLPKKYPHEKLIKF